MRVRPPASPRERAEALEDLARVSMTEVGPEVPDPVLLLEEISLTHVEPHEGQDGQPIPRGLARGWWALGLKIGSAAHYVRTLGTGDGVEVGTADSYLEWISLTGTEPGSPSGDLAVFGLSETSHHPSPEHGRDRLPYRGFI